MIDKNDRQVKADAAKVLALDLYEQKIKDKVISASEMAVYLKLLQQLGLEGAIPAAPSTATKAELPTFNDEGDDNNVIDMPRRNAL